MSDVLLSVPTRGAIQWATVERLQEIRDATPGLAPIVYQQGNLSVAQTRNRIVRRFLDTPFSALAMIDDDVVPPPFFLELRKHLGEYGMIAVPHPMPHPNDPSQIALTAFQETGRGLATVAVKEGVHECDAVATGSVIVSRKAIEKLGPAPFRIASDPEAPVTSDDFLFCEDLRSAGFKIAYAYLGGWFSDHHSTVALAPLMEATLTERRHTHVPR